MKTSETKTLIASILNIPKDAAPHGDIQAEAGIDFETLEVLADELGAEKLAVKTMNRFGWHFTKADEIIALAKKRNLEDPTYRIAQDIMDTEASFLAEFN